DAASSKVVGMEAVDGLLPVTTLGIRAVDQHDPGMRRWRAWNEHRPHQPDGVACECDVALIVVDDSRGEAFGRFPTAPMHTGRHSCTVVLEPVGPEHRVRRANGGTTDEGRFGRRKHWSLATRIGLERIELPERAADDKRAPRAGVEVADEALESRGRNGRRARKLERTARAPAFHPARKDAMI